MAYMEQVMTDLPINSLSSIDSEANASSSRALTAQNKVFLTALASGKTTLESYKEAGYKGSDHAAYELRSQLKAHLIDVLESQGIDRAGLLTNIKALLELPLKESEITIKHKLDLLKLLAKTVVNEPSNKPSITPFILNNNVTIEPSNSVKSVDTSIEE